MKILLKIIILLIFFNLINLQKIYAEEKINIGLLIPLSGEQKEIGKSIMQSVRLAINKIDNSNIQIIPKDTKDDPIRTLAAAKELELKGVKIVIGPIFNKNLIYLDELKEMIFLSLTNKNIKNPKNVISAGINASSQINTIVKFKNQNDINKTIFLIPDSDFKEEIEDFNKKFPMPEHPVIRTHPDTGKKLIYVNAAFTKCIKDWEVEESSNMLKYLYSRASTPEYQCRFVWKDNSIAFWDNRSVQHYAASDYWPQVRKVERVTIIGDRPR